MSYTPTTWKAGDTVTSEKLNKIEQGIANHNIVEATMDNETFIITLNKTWQEIWDNNYTNMMIILDNNGSLTKQFLFIQGIGIYNETYTIGAKDPNASIQVTFTCNSPDDYPTSQQ